MSLIHDIEPYPELPSELVLVIFETAAQDCKLAAATLALVSRRIRAFMLPFLFHTLILRHRKNAHALGRFLRTHPHVAAHVRAIFLRESTSADYALFVPCMRLARVAALPGCLSALCGYGNRLALRTGTDNKDVRVPPICTPRELLVFPGCVDWHDFDVSVDYTRTFFDGLTHLWLTQPSQVQKLMYHKQVVSTLSRLTHLATPLFGHSLHVQKILDAFPALQVLIITAPAAYEPQLCPWYPRTSKDWSMTNNLRFPHDKRVHIYRFPEQKVENVILSLWKEGKNSLWDKALGHTDNA